MRRDPTGQLTGGHLRVALAVLIGALAIAPSAHAVPRVSMVKDLNPADGPKRMAGIGKTLFFGAPGGGHGNELWKSDGTRAGTKLVKNIHPDDCGASPGSDPGGFTNVDGTLFFLAKDCKHGAEIWRSDGTRSGTRRLTNIPYGNGERAGNLTNVDGRLFFSRNQYVSDPPRLWFRSDLWKSNGTRSGTKYIRSFWSEERWPEEFRKLDGRLVFAANARYRGQELWKSDGTRAGTRVVKDINRGRDGSYPSALRKVGGRLFFAANDGIHSSELWKSDGTRHGTKLVKDINRSFGGRGSSSPGFLMNVDGRLFFSAYTSDTGRELWKSDGTRAGTKLVKDIYPGEPPSESDPRSLANLGGKLLFEAEDPTHGRELWKSDGTRAGTKLVKDIYPGINPGVRRFATETTSFDGGVLFSVAEPSHGSELWWSDGTRAGTRLVEDINPGPGSSSPRSLAKAGHAVFFEANDGTHGPALWKAVR